MEAIENSYFCVPYERLSLSGYPRGNAISIPLSSKHVFKEIFYCNLASAS
jgi:hypothetical protein